MVKFADSISKSPMAQKKAFKILSIILKNQELNSYEELQELFTSLTGYAHNPHQQKQKLVMLKIFLSKIKKDDKDDDMKDDVKSDDSDEEDEDDNGTIEINDEQRNEIISTILPEIISGYSSHQLKSQKLAESLLTDLVKIYRNHFNELLKKLLAGFAGDKIETRAATILILTKILKTNEKDFSKENLTKITNIVVLFMKEKSAYIQRVVLKLLKRLTSMMNKESLELLCSKIICSIVDCEHRKKLNLRIKYVISNLIKKLTKERVKELTPDEHKALIEYTHKMKRREENQQKQLLSQLKEHKTMSKLEQESEKTRLIEGEREAPHDSDSDEVEEDSDSSDEEQEVNKDKNIDSRNDIPIVRNLKTVTNDPDEQPDEESDEESKKKKKAKRLAQIDRMMEINEEEFDTHFHDNPILMVKKRQEQRRKLLEKKLRDDKHSKDDVDDLYYETKSRKFYVKDVEKVEREVKKAEKRKREQRDEYLEKMIPDDMKKLIDIEDKVKTLNAKRKRVDDGDEEMEDNKQGIQLPGRTDKRGKSKVADGHFIKKSADFYRGKDGKSDVLKKGEFEPYAYIKLNPQMMNKRHRDKAVKSFESIIPKKKTDKRRNKK